MEKDDSYYFHQTPIELAGDILKAYNHLFQDGDVLYEAFKGEGAFYNQFPERCIHKWAEITEGKDYKDETEYDWVITNPPFKLGDRKKGENAFWILLDYFTQRAKKGIVFLANDVCFNSITPKRQAVLRERGWGLTHLTMCNVKAWRGRYYIMVYEPTDKPIMNFLTKTY